MSTEGAIILPGVEGVNFMCFERMSEGKLEASLRDREDTHSEGTAPLVALKQADGDGPNSRSVKDRGTLLVE
jgi:hypothetical protein